MASELIQVLIDPIIHRHIIKVAMQPLFVISTRKKPIFMGVLARKIKLCKYLFIEASHANIKRLKNSSLCEFINILVSYDKFINNFLLVTL